MSDDIPGFKYVLDSPDSEVGFVPAFCPRRSPDNRFGCVSHLDEDSKVVGVGARVHADHSVTCRGASDPAVVHPKG